MQHLPHFFPDWSHPMTFAHKTLTFAFLVLGWQISWQEFPIYLESSQGWPKTKSLRLESNGKFSIKSFYRFLNDGGFKCPTS